MSKRFVLLLFLCTQLLTGCWDVADVKDMVFPSIAGFDYRNGKYLVFLNYPILGNAQEKSDVLKAEGKTPGQASIDQGNKSSRIVSQGDLRGFVIGRDLAFRGTQGVFETFLRVPEISLRSMLVVFDGPTEELFNIKPKQYQTVGDNVLDIMRNSPKKNFVPDEDLYRFMLNVFTDGHNPVLPVIRIHHQDHLEVSGAALFKKFQMVALVDETEMRTLTWLRGEPSQGHIFIEFEDESGKTHQVTFVGGNKCSVKAKLVQGVPVFEVDVMLQGMLTESLDGLRYAGEEEHVRLVEEALAKQVQQQCEDLVVDLQQKYRVDAILLGKYARVYMPELVQQDWDEVFCNSDIRVKVKVKIMGTGEIA